MFENAKRMMELFDELGSSKVLIAGMDISKNKFTITAVNGRYEIKIKTKDINLTKKELDKLYKEIDDVIKNDQVKQIIFGCEPSGIYYKPVMRALTTKYPEAMFKLVNPSATKSNRDQKMEENKTDAIDTYAITDLLIRGECYDIQTYDSTFDMIKNYVRELDHLVKESVRIKNRMHAYTDELYPGLESESNSFLESEYGIRFLKVLPEPHKLPKLSTEAWQKLLSIDGYRLSKPLAMELKNKSNNLVFSKHQNFKIVKDFILFLVEEYEQLARRKERIRVKLDELIYSLEFGESIKELRGIQTFTIARMLAYMGNPYRFRSGKEVAAFAGITPKSDQSGKVDKKKELSRKGHKKLRTTLVQAAQQVITSTAYFTAYYNRLVIENRKDPMVAIMATANKLIRVIMKMVHTGESFNPPTVKDKELAKGKIERLTRKKLEEFNKMQRSNSLTQDIKELYPTRV